MNTKLSMFRLCHGCFSNIFQIKGEKSKIRHSNKHETEEPEQEFGREVLALIEQDIMIGVD